MKKKKRKKSSWNDLSVTFQLHFSAGEGKEGVRMKDSQQNTLSFRFLPNPVPGFLWEVSFLMRWMGGWMDGLMDG